MKGPLLAEDGARFETTIQRTAKGPQASFLVVLDIGNDTLTESDLQLFDNEDDARKWLEDHAARRGFKSFPLSFK